MSGLGTLREVLDEVRGMDDGQLLFFLGCLCPAGGMRDVQRALAATERYMPDPVPAVNR